MKRTAQPTIRLSKALVKQGHGTSTPRNLERWSGEGLGPPGAPDFSALVRHYGQVASLTTTGRDFDTVARKLAARGFACERLREVVLREFNISPEPPEVAPSMPDLSSGPSGDLDFASTELLAYTLMADTHGVPPLMVKVVRALQRNAAQRAEQIGESADVIFHSFVVNCLVHLMGADYYNAKAMEAVFGFDRGTISVEVLDTLNSKLRMSIPDLEDAYRTVPLEEIAFMAHRLTTWAPHLFAYLKVSGVRQGEIEDLAVAFAPGTIHYVGLLREAFDDFADEPIPLAPPVPELAAAASE